MFDGDLTQGLKMVITLFEDETKAMLELSPPAAADWRCC
jgi:hypothetical protein